jgi:hypothetical protein
MIIFYVLQSRWYVRTSYIQNALHVIHHHHHHHHHPYVSVCCT